MSDVFTRDKFRADDEDVGVSIDDLAGALMTWTAMQSRDPTVAEAMVTFNTTREVIVEAIKGQYYAYLSDEACADPATCTIELDGE